MVGMRTTPKPLFVARRRVLDISIYKWLFILAVGICTTVSFYLDHDLRKTHDDTLNVNFPPPPNGKEMVRGGGSLVDSAAEEVANCTPKDMSIIKKQLPADDCVRNRGAPWTQECSMSYATKCPDAVWL
mmetsp:Transcript_19201/g.46088  ORF Transcript_19201/g.46088 Transcript_19201/m.46088 type:complete len:129 (+) Transcript_19201:391-777(+)